MSTDTTVEKTVEVAKAFASAETAVDRKERKRQLFEVAEAIAAGLAKSFQELPVPDDEDAVRHLVWYLARGMNIEDPYDRADELDEEHDRLKDVLDKIRGEIRKGDIGHAMLLIDYEVR